MSKIPHQKYLIMLYLLEVIVDRGSLNKDALLYELDLSDVSFKRYLACLRQYFLFVHPSWRIVYRRSKLAYELYRGLDR
jgi:hypothetical protein